MIASCTWLAKVQSLRKRWMNNFGGLSSKSARTGQGGICTGASRSLHTILRSQRLRSSRGQPIQSTMWQFTAAVRSLLWCRSPLATLPRSVSTCLEFAAPVSVANSSRCIAILGAVRQLLLWASGESAIQFGPSGVCTWWLSLHMLPGLWRAWLIAVLLESLTLVLACRCERAKSWIHFNSAGVRTWWS